MDVLDEPIIVRTGEYSASLCLTSESRESAFRIRYEAYRASDALDVREPPLFRDHFDGSRSRVHLAYHQGIPVGSIRACVSKGPFDRDNLTAWQCYSDEISAFCGDAPIVESNRFVVHPDVDVQPLRLHTLLFRMIAANAILENATYLITAVRDNHVNFYQRTMKLQPISDAKTYPGLHAKMVLMGGNYLEQGVAVASKMPQFFPSASEVEAYRQCLERLR